MGEKDDLPLTDIEKNADVDTTEKSPLKDPEQDPTEEVKEPIENGIKEVKPGNLVQTLNDPKTRLLVAIVAGVLLLLVAGSATVALLIFGSQPAAENWIEDPIPRMLRLVPSPNSARNTIRFRLGHNEEGKYWPELTNEIVNLYEVYNKSAKPNAVYCDKRATPPADPKRTCSFDISDIEKVCNKENSFGYAQGSPCIFIQFSQVYNFTPETFTKGDFSDEALPTELKNEYQYTGPWVDCKPNEKVDIENAGELKIIPSREWPRAYFPYTGHPEYMAPVIALKLEKPATAVNIGITCRLWARNIKFNETSSGLNDTMVDDVFVPSAILPFNVYIE